MAQQSGFAPPQLAGPRHSMVSFAAHVGWQTGTSVVRSAQQVPVPEHGTVGHVGPASPPLPLLEPLLLPELLPLPLPLLLPELLPPELPLELVPPELLPDDELPLLASAPELPPGLLLLEQPAHDSAPATTTAVARERARRGDMRPS